MNSYQIEVECKSLACRVFDVCVRWMRAHGVGFDVANIHPFEPYRFSIENVAVNGNVLMYNNLPINFTVEPSDAESNLFELSVQISAGDRELFISRFTHHRWNGRVAEFTLFAVQFVLSQLRALSTNFEAMCVALGPSVYDFNVPYYDLPSVSIRVPAALGAAAVALGAAAAAGPAVVGRIVASAAKGSPNRKSSVVVRMASSGGASKKPRIGAAAAASGAGASGTGAAASGTAAAAGPAQNP